MSNIDLSIHDVIDVEVESVQANRGGDVRWQRIIVHTADGSAHRLVTFLHATNAGMEASLKRRVDDVPRQPVLYPE